MPGLTLGLAFAVLSYIVAIKRNYPKEKKVTFREALKITWNSLLGLATAVIIIGGVLSGVFTATESAAVACIYAFIITFFVYKEIPLKAFSGILFNALKTLAMVMSLIASASAFGWLLAYLKVPALATTALLSVTQNKYILLLLINFLLLGLGCIMDMAPLILIVTPILLPVMTSMGVDPVHFGVMLILNLAIGLCTPPVGSACDWDRPLHRRAGIRNAADRSAAGDAAALRAFRGCDQLQKFLRIVKPLLEFRAQRLGRNLGCNADLAGRRIGRDKSYFVDADRSCLAVPEGALDLFDHVLGPGSAHGECPHQLDKFVLGDLVRKMDAGQTRRGQQLREAALRLPRLQRNSVQQQLVFRDAQQERPVRSLGQTVLQFFPGDCELAFGAFVVEPIEADVLHQYVQTVDKRPGGRDPAAFACVCR